MKVAFITHATDPNAGASKALLSLITQAREQGLEPLVITPDKNGLYNDWRNIGIETLYIDYRPATYPPLHTIKDRLMLLPRTTGRIILNHRASKKLRQILLNRNIDIVHSNTSVLSIGRDATAGTSIPHIYHFREYADLGLNMHYIPSWYIFHRKARKSFSICITQCVQEHHGLSNSDLSAIVYDGVMPKQPEPNLDTQKSYFLFAGRIEPAKGLHNLITAYADYVSVCKSNNVCPLPLYAAGASRMPHYMSQIQKMITSYGIQDNIKFLGERTDIYTLMSQATAIVISCEYEGFGLCMAEAMFKGCLAIGHNSAGTKEQFDKGKQFTGAEIGIRYNTTDELSEALTRVHNSSPEAFTNMKKRAFDTVNTLYTTERNTEGILSFYRRITDRLS